MSLLPVLDFIAKPVTQYLKNYGEINKAKHDRDLAIIENQSRLAADRETYNHQWELESLKGNSHYLRIACFIQLALPLTITCVWPEKGQDIFRNLEAVPQWFVQLYMIVIGSVWGIHEFKSAAPQVIGAALARSLNKERKNARNKEE